MSSHLSRGQDDILSPVQGFFTAATEPQSQYNSISFVFLSWISTQIFIFHFTRRFLIFYRFPMSHIPHFLVQTQHIHALFLQVFSPHLEEHQHHKHSSLASQPFPVAKLTSISPVLLPSGHQHWLLAKMQTGCARVATVPQDSRRCLPMTVSSEAWCSRLY